jgi:integrase
MRVVPLPGTLIKALKVHQERSIRIGLEDYIFCYDSGEPVTYTFFRKRYDNMFERLKLPERDPDGGRRTPYSLKVSLETHLIDAGADPVHVREYMGHAHTMGNRTLTSVQARYKRRQASILRESLLPYIETLLTGIYV